MIASAFHDLASRTQLNSFVVEKQAQGPSSFLAQQRSSIHSLSKKDWIDFRGIYVPWIL